MKDDACYIAVVDSTSNGRTASVAREKWPAFLIVPALALVALLRVTLGLGDASFASTRLVSLERDHRDDDRAGIFYGPISFDAEPGQALNKEKTVSSFAEAPKVFYRTSGGERKRYGSAQFSNASAWNGGDAKMMLGFVLADDIGVQRDVHWHTKGDEWAYVIKGTWTLTMAAPTAFSAKSRERTVPWQVTYGHSGPDSVWYFPAGWWHTIVCETPGGCAAILFFNSPPSVRVDLNSPQLAQAMHGPGEGSFGPNGMPPFVAAHVLGTSVEKAKKVQARVAGAAARDLQTEYLLGSVFDLTNACDPLTGRCPPAPAADTPPDDFPAVVQMKASEGISTRTWPFLEGGDWVGCAAADAAAAAADGSDGALDAGEAGYGGEAHAAPPLPDFAAVTAWDVTAANGFPLLSLSSQGGRGGSAGQGISGQLLEMQPGSTRPPVWTLNADAVLFVVYGSITLYLYSGDEFTGFAPSEAEGISPARQTQQITLSANQAAYVPLNNLYWFTAGCEAGGAKLTLAFNHPEWEEIGMRESLALFPTFEIEGALNEPGPTSRG